MDGLSHGQPNKILSQTDQSIHTLLSLGRAVLSTDWLLHLNDPLLRVALRRLSVPLTDGWTAAAAAAAAVLEISSVLLFRFEMCSRRVFSRSLRALASSSVSSCTKAIVLSRGSCAPPGRCQGMGCWIWGFEWGFRGIKLEFKFIVSIGGKNLYCWVQIQGFG